MTDAIHDLMGNTCASTSRASHARVNQIFETMDLNRDGLISMEEFLAYCNTSKDVRDSMMVNYLKSSAVEILTRS